MAEVLCVYREVEMRRAAGGAGEAAVAVVSYDEKPGIPRCNPIPFNTIPRNTIRPARRFHWPGRSVWWARCSESPQQSSQRRSGCSRGRPLRLLRASVLATSAALLPTAELLCAALSPPMSRRWHSRGRSGRASSRAVVPAHPRCLPLDYAAFPKTRLGIQATS